MLRIKKSEFVTSVGKNGGYPSEGGAEIAIVGKSNVGKSSIINSLCNMNKLAKTSQKPGKTRLINYFRINGDFYIVDLPGYGFAQASKQEQAQWGELIESYLASGRVKHIFMLVDIRHEPTRDDKQMFKYILYYAIPKPINWQKRDANRLRLPVPANSAHHRMQLHIRVKPVTAGRSCWKGSKRLLTVT